MINTLRIRYQKWLVLLAIGASTFMTALDTSVVNTVLPVINDSFNSTLTKTEWIITIYLLLVSGLLISFGRLGDIIGHKKIFLTGFGIFILSSSLCGFAPSVDILIASRAFQALGAALLAANSPAILVMNFPENQRGQALGIQATMTYLGLTAAPSIGGWLTDLISWRAVFYINVPIGLFALVSSWRFIPPDLKRNLEGSFDFPGAIVFIIGLVALLLGLNQGHAWGWLSPPLLGILSISILAMIAFIFIETKRMNPMIDLNLFKKRGFSAAVGNALLIYISMFGITLLMPFYLLQIRSLSPSQAGHILTVQPVIMACIAPIAGTISDKIGTRLPSMLGMAFVSLGAFLLSGIKAQTPLLQISLLLGFIGVGIGTFISPNNSAIMGAAPQSRQGTVAGIVATARSTGMVLGVAMAGAIYATISNRFSGDQALFQAIQTTFRISGGLAFFGALLAMIRE